MEKKLINYKILDLLHLLLGIFVLIWLNSSNSLFFNNIPAIIKVAIFIFWFIMACLKKNYVGKVISYSWPLIYMILLTLLCNNNIAMQYYRQNFMYIFMILTVFIYYSDEKNPIFRKIILFFLLIDILYIGINTYINLIREPLLARYLSAGEDVIKKITGGEIYNDVGSYGYFYSLVMIAILFLYKIIDDKKYRIINIIIFILLIILLFQGEFTISLLLLIISSFLTIILYNRKKDNVSKIAGKIFFGVIIIIIVFCNMPNILEAISSIEGLPEEIKARTIEIRNKIVYGKNDDKTDLEARTTAYSKSLDTFFNNIFFGSFGKADSIGGHSMIFDLLALYGVLAVPFFYFLYRIFKYIKTFCESCYIINIIFIYFIMLSIINTSVFANIFITLLVVVPFFIKENNINDKNDSLNEVVKKNKENDYENTLDSQHNISISS